MTKFDGEIWTEIIEVKFAFAGKVAWVNKKPGDLVKKWDTLASLNNKLLQMELDRQLADYEKTRAAFEIFTRKNQGTSDIDNFLKTSEQAQLNISVKDVELAKAKLDQVILSSPVDGLVISSGGCRVGLYVTPSSASFQVLDSSSTVFRFKVTSKDVGKIAKPTEVKVTLFDLKKVISGTTRLPIPDNRGDFTVDVVLKDSLDLMPGFKGKVELS